MSNADDTARAMELLAEFQTVLKRKDETIERQAEKIDDLQREVDHLREETKRLAEQLANRQSEDDSAKDLETTDHLSNKPESLLGATNPSDDNEAKKPLSRFSPTHRSISLRTVNVHEKVVDFEERRKSVEMENEQASGRRSSKENGSTPSNVVVAISEVKSDDETTTIHFSRERRRSETIDPMTTRPHKGHTRRNTVTVRPETPLFMRNDRKRRLTTRRNRLPADRSDKTWQGSIVLSPNMDIRIREKILQELSKKYAKGDLQQVQSAARVIQTAYRSFVMRRRLTFIRAIPPRQRTRTLPAFVRVDAGYPSLLAETRKAARSRHQLLNRSRSQSPSRVLNGNTAITEEDEATTETDGRSGDATTEEMRFEEGVNAAPTVVVVVESVAQEPSPSPSPDDEDLKRNGDDDTLEISSICGGDDDVNGGAGGHEHRRVQRKISTASLLSSATLLSDFGDLVHVRALHSGTEGRTAEQRTWQLGINHFNRKPNKGVLYFVARGLVDDSPVAVAEFLLTRKGLSKLKIGEYIGSFSEFNIAVLQQFAKAIHLKGITFVAALRKYQSHFILPGEALQIERIIEAFAAQFVLCNPRVVSESQDTIFVLAYSVIMLNTDLHNVNVKRKMTKAQFVHNNRGIDNGKDLSKFFLENVYDDIANQELTPAKDHTTEVDSLEKSISGLTMRLALPPRQLVHMTQLCEVPDPFRRQSKNEHPRVVIIFNDLLLLIKENSKRAKTDYRYHFKTCLPLCGLMVQTFENAYYKCGITLRETYEKERTLHLCAHKELTRDMFVRDLCEVLHEVDDMESERIGELKMTPLKSPARKNRGGTVSLHEDSELNHLRPPRTSSVTLSPQPVRRISAFAVNPFQEGRSTSFPADLNMLGVESSPGTRSPSPSNSSFRSSRGLSPSPSVVSNESIIKKSIFSGTQKKAKKKDKAKR